MPPVSLDKSSQRVRTMFDEIAPRYDFLNHFLSLGIDRRWRRKSVRILSPKDSSPLLDVCCGTGDLAMEYAQRFPVPVFGSDFSPEMLRRAQKKIEKIKNRPHLLVADTLALPFPDHTFQLVTVAFGLRNVSDTDGGLKEMVRVCQPGGRVGVLEFTIPRFLPLGYLYSWYFRYLLPRIGQTAMKNRSSAYEYLPQSVSSFPQYEALAEKMRAAGLKEVQFTSFTFGIATLYWGEKD